MKKSKNIMTIVFVLSLIVLTGCGNTVMEQTESTTDYQPITANVVATINGEEILSNDVNMVQQMYLQQGYQISEQEVVDLLIDQRLLYQEVKNDLMSSEEAESIIAMDLAQLDMTLEDYKNDLESSGISYLESLEEIKIDIAINEYLENAMGDLDLEITDEEIEEFYESFKIMYPDEEIPPLEDSKPEIMMILQNERQNEKIYEIVSELRAKADIQYN